MPASYRQLDESQKALLRRLFETKPPLSSSIIAARMGVSVNRVRRLANEWGYNPPADNKPW